MSIVLFAIIGAMLNAGVAYWICFAFFCVAKAVSLVASILNAASKN